MERINVLSVLFSLSYCFSYVSETVAQSQAHILNELPALYAGVRFEGELSPSLKHEQTDALHLPHIKSSKNEYTSEPFPESRSQSGFVRLSSSYTLNIDADSLRPAKGTACVTEALDSGQRKKWQCFNEQGHHRGVTIDLNVSRNNKFEVSLPVIQDITVQYLPLLVGETNPLYEFHQPDIVKAALRQSLENKKKIDKTVQKASAMFKMSIKGNMDDPSIKAISFKLINDISQEDEQVFQDRIKNIMLSDRPEMLKNIDNIPLLPDTTLRLSSHGLQFAGKISNLAGGKGDGAKSNSKNKKQSKESSGKQPSTSLGASSSGARSPASAEYKFKSSENCPYCQNQISEKNLGTGTNFELRENNFEKTALSDNRIGEFDHYKLIRAIKENNRYDVKSYLNEFPHRIDALIDYRRFNMNYASLLSIAILENKPEIVKLLLEMGADVNQKEDPILLACSWIRKENTKEKLEIIHHLLRWGTNPNVCEEGIGRVCTPLTFCIKNDSVEAAKLLLNHGASVYPQQSLTDKQQADIYQYYFECSDDYGLDILDLLLEHGFNIEIPYHGLYPIHIALLKMDCNTEKVIKKLVERGADLNMKAKSGGATPLQFAVTAICNSKIMKEVVIYLIANGADPEIKGSFPEKTCYWLTPARREKHKGKTTALRIVKNNAEDESRRRYGQNDNKFYKLYQLMNSEFEVQKAKAKIAREKAETKVPESSTSSPDINTPEDEQTGAAAIEPSPLKKLIKKFKSKFRKNPNDPAAFLPFLPEPSAPPAPYFPEPSAPPAEDNDEISSPPYNPNNIAPPPYSEEDPNPPAPPYAEK